MPCPEFSSIPGQRRLKTTRRQLIASNSVTGDNLSPVTMEPEINLSPVLTTTQAKQHVEIGFGKNLSSIRVTE
jgi:hypothetical protein